MQTKRYICRLYKKYEFSQKRIPISKITRISGITETNGEHDEGNMSNNDSFIEAFKNLFDSKYLTADEDFINNVDYKIKLKLLKSKLDGIQNKMLELLCDEYKVWEILKMLKITFKTFKENIEEIKMVAKEIFDVDYKVEEDKQIIIKSENNESEIVINIKQKLTLDQCNLFELTYRNEKVWKILKTLHISYKKYKDNLKSINDILINEFNITSIDLLKASNNGI